jgi:sulfate transport system ATP-binding protein
MDVEIRNISKAFGDTPALEGVDLQIRSGELIALLGPSGSGKTTLLRILAGLEFPTGGQVFFGSDDASEKTVQERNLGFVFQHYALFKHMTVVDNIGFGLRVRPRETRPSRAETRKRALELLDLVQLSGLENRFPAQLSGGQRQRVALARALAIEPRVLLLDEPFGALDAQVRRDLRRWLRELHDRTGHTTVFVTHDQEEALELADRVVVMSSGRIEQVGTADEIYDMPRSEFVFSFIGESSALPVTVQNGRIFLDDHALDAAAYGIPDGPAQMFVRPHDIELVEECPDGIAGVATMQRRQGGHKRVEIEIGAARHRLQIDVPADHPKSLAGRICVKPRRFRLFPSAQSGSQAA